MVLCRLPRQLLRKDIINHTLINTFQRRCLLCPTFNIVAMVNIAQGKLSFVLKLQYFFGIRITYDIAVSLLVS